MDYNSTSLNNFTDVILPSSSSITKMVSTSLLSTFRRSYSASSSLGSGDSDDGATEILHVVLLLVLAGVLLSMSLEVLQHRYHITWLPGPATAVVIGSAIGLILRLSADEGDIPEEIGFSGTVFFLILLPIIIFQAGYSLRKREFFGQLFSILIFSIVGTVITAVTIGLILYGAGTAGWTLELSLNEAMAYASLLSATDAVAVANVYRALDADPLLTVMIYGEGSVNDAASIVMYQTFSSFIEDGISDEGIATAGEHFAAELFGSVALGLGVAILATFLFRCVHMGWIPQWISKICPCCPRSRTALPDNGDDENLVNIGTAYDNTPLLTPKKTQPNATKETTGTTKNETEEINRLPKVIKTPSRTIETAMLKNTPGVSTGVVRALLRDREIKPDSSVFAQTSFILTIGYLSYMAAESCHFSGVVSVLVSGIGLSHFVRPLMTTEGKDFSEGTVRVLAEIADMACFFQVGLDMALNFGTTRGIDTNQDISLVGFVILGILLGRAISVFGLSALLNYYRRTPIPLAHQIMLWHAGLRGAGAYAFALVFPTHNRDVFVDITAAIVLITVLACGATTTRMLTLTGVPWGHHDSNHHHHPVTSGSSDIHHAEGYQSTDGQLTDNTSSSPNGNYRVVIIQGARVFIPNGPIETESTRRDRAVGWINRWDTKIRYWISGVVRED